MSLQPVDALSERPLEGAKFCCTSILPEHRDQLARWVEDMGAEHTLDLTSDVTHLLVGDSDSEKYRYVAREREDVKALLPSFVEALRELWMNHQPINFNAVEAEHRCPTFYGLRISITGFEHQAFRDMLAINLAKEGAEYSGDLTKEVTHLIANKPEGKKYQYASGWGLKIVSIKWYQDSLQRGMQLSESKYHPTIPASEQGVGAWNRLPSGMSPSGKRERVEPVEEKRSRKIRRTASAKFGSQHNEMWSNIVGQSAPDVVGPPTRQVQSSEAMTERQEGSLVSKDVNQVVDARESTKNSKPTTEKGMFHGRHFAFKGFDDRKSRILREYIAGHDGEVHAASELFRRPQMVPDAFFLLVPHETSEQHLSRLKTTCGEGITIVTELWLEYCISIKAFCLPKDYPLGFPLSLIHSPAVMELTINASGFPQIQLSHIAKAVKQIGAKYEETFTARTSVLICNSRSMNKQKTDHAQRWKIPVVSEKWLVEMIESQRIPSFEPYLSVQSVQRDVEHLNRSTPTEVHQDNRPKPQPDLPQPGPAVGQIETLSDGFDLVPAEENVQQAGVGQIQRMKKQDLTKPTPGPLREVSGNAQKKAPSKAKKKKLFQQVDGPMSDSWVMVDENGGDRGPEQDMSTPATVIEVAIGSLKPDGTENLEIQDREYQKKLVADFLEVKAAAEAKAAVEAAKGSQKGAKPRRLLGRALSNLSNTSKRSNDQYDTSERERQPLSRASSINSANTDGLGMPLSMMSRIPSDLQNKPKEQDVGSLSAGNDASAPIILDAALIALGTSQVPRPASPTASQMPVKLTYAESEEAAALKAHLAEKRRNRAKLGQQKGDPEPELSREESEELRQRLWREREATKSALGTLQDDEAVVGVGRRTRGREKALSKLLGDVDDVMEL